MYSIFIPKDKNPYVFEPNIFEQPVNTMNIHENFFHMNCHSYHIPKIYIYCSRQQFEDYFSNNIKNTNYCPKPKNTIILDIEKIPYNVIIHNSIGNIFTGFKKECIEIIFKKFNLKIQ